MEFPSIATFFIAGFIAYIIGKIVFNLKKSEDTLTTRVGGRPRRKKKPTFRVSDRVFHFEGDEETLTSLASLYNEEYYGLIINITDIVPLPNGGQRIEFDQSINGELDEITIEFE
jgi:hypothetical protein